MTPARRGQWASRGHESARGGVEKNGIALREQCEQVFRAEPSSQRFHITWGCTGFDAVIGRIGLRVRALFPLINEQTKLNATDNVVVADFSRAAARRAA